MGTRSVQAMSCLGLLFANLVPRLPAIGSILGWLFPAASFLDSVPPTNAVQTGCRAGLALPAPDTGQRSRLAALRLGSRPFDVVSPRMNPVDPASAVSGRDR
jgi:hypothetical protein